MSRVDDGLRKIFRKHLRRRAHWQSVETGSTSRGVPDSSCCMEGAPEFWIEFKSVRRGWSVKMRPEQIGWLLRRERMGGRTFVGVRRRTGVADELWMFSGKYARELKDEGLRGPVPMGLWKGGPERWSWDEVRYVLTH